MWWLYFYYVTANGNVFPHIPKRFDTYLEAISWMISTPISKEFTLWELRTSPLPEDDMTP